MRFCEVPGCASPVFGTCKVTRKGFCKRHQTLREDYDRRTILQKALAKQKGLESKVRGLGSVQDEEKNELELWFLMRMNTCKPVCENCGAAKYNLVDDEYKKMWRSCQAHLLPKRHFKSLQTHPLNGMVMGSGFSGMCHCHDDYDHDWERASKMKIWPEVIRRFKIMYPLITESEHRFIPKQLLETLK